jgi:Flp pilus assembly protein TadD
MANYLSIHRRVILSLGALSFQILLIGPGVLQAEPWAFVERPLSANVYPGDIDARHGHENLLAGNCGNAISYFTRAVDAFPQNAAAWIGLASCYDRIKKFQLADRAYHKALVITGENVVYLNNRGYSFLLRGDIQKAREYFQKAKRLAPADPTIANNLTMTETGEDYFWGAAPYLWGWPK